MSDEADAGRAGQRTPEQDQALVRLQTAINDRNVVGILEGLETSGTLDGLKQVLAQKWRIFQEVDIHHFVADAADKLCKTIVGGEKVLNVGAFIWKTADWGAHREYRRRQRERPVDPVSLDARPQSEDRAELVRQAVAIARRLIQSANRWGDNMRAVLTYYVDAAEAGRVHLPHQEVAEALGLDVDLVRQLVRRGFKSLHRVARQEGYSADEFDMGAVVDGPDEE